MFDAGSSVRLCLEDKMKPLSYLFAGVLALGTGMPLSAENLIFNSSFELGSMGIGCKKFLRSDRNPELKYEAPEIDATQFMSGRHSLRILNRYAEAVELSSSRFSLKPDTDYVLTLWLKSSQESYPFYFSVVSNAPWSVPLARTVTLGKEWRQYSAEFRTGAAPKFDDCCLRMLFGIKDRPVDIWLDELCLTEKTASSDRAASGIEAAIDCPSLLICDAAESAPLTVDTRLFNASRQTVKGTLTVRAKEEGKDAEISSDPISFLLPPGSGDTISCRLPLNSYGRYLITPGIETVGRHREMGRTVAVAGKYESRPLDPAREFCLGFTYDAGGDERPGWFALFGAGTIADGIKTEHGDVTSALAQMGCRLIRPWDRGLCWRDIEPEPGKFRFDMVDRLIELKKRYGMEILPIIGGMDFVERSHRDDCGLPAWLKPKCQVRDFPALQRRAYLPPLESWRRYVRAIAQHSKGSFTCFEIMNEPNIIFSSAGDYSPYLKAAREELKAVNSRCKVVGFSVTSDLGAKALPFLETCFKDGDLNDADIVSFHPYASQGLGSKQSADETIAAMKRVIGSYTKKSRPLWNTELYYLHDVRPGATNSEKLRFEPCHAAWRFLTDLGEGLGQSITINVPSQIFSKSPDQNDEVSAGFVAYNALARLFEGARPVDKIRWGGDGICYVYERNGRYLAAFWNYSGKANLKLQLPISAISGRLYDLYGNPLPLAGGTLPLDASPYYLECTGGTLQKFVGALKAAGIK